MSKSNLTAVSSGDARRHSISSKIIFLVFLCTFSTALVISWISIHATHAQLRAQIDHGFPTALERSRGELAPWLERATESLEALRNRSTRATRRSDKMLQKFAAESENFDAVGVVAEDGAWVIAINGRDEANPADARLSKQTADLDASAPTHIALELAGAIAPAVALPVKNGDRRNGFLIARYDVRAVERLLESQLEAMPATLMISDGDGRVLASVGCQADDHTDALHTVTQLSTGDAGTIQEYASDSGVHVLGSILPLGENSDWHLIVEAPFSQAFAPVLAVVSKIFVADLLIILVFIAFAYRITTRMLRPIEDLSEGARQVSRGDLGLAISDPGTHDEIGLLTRSFNEMMVKLQQSQHEVQEANRQLTAQNEELQRANEVLSQLSITDGLTKLHNHRYFQESLTREIKRQSRRAEPLSILLVDLDDFKGLNDRLGHAAGDELLMRVASIMAATVRESDLLARYGGEEFVVLTTDTELEGAVALAEKIRMAVEQTPHIVDDSLRPVRITVSVGVAQYRGNRRLFFESADRALYRAKDQGKNCVVVDQEE